MALIHACTLQTGSFVGMGAVVMDGVLVETGAMIAAGARVTPRWLEQVNYGPGDQRSLCAH
jgi:carbonic anhydrase/acetyltransferase-like protein (isoleucine patch superfamily)